MTSPLALVVTGAPLAARTADIASAAVAAGWEVSVVTTPASLPWLEPGPIEEVTGRPPRHLFRSPDQGKPPRPEAVVVVPATFNTVNKLVVGIADNYATSLLCESLGSGVPMVVAPMVNDALWGHPSWPEHLARLAAAGVVLLDVSSGATEAAPVPSGSSQRITENFDPAWVLAALPHPG